MKKSLKIFVIGLLVLVSSFACEGVINSSNHLQIDLTDPNDVNAKAVWSPQNKLTVTKQGLGWDGEANAHIDGWIKTKLVAIGLSWRPTYAANISVKVKTPIRIVTHENSQKTFYGLGQLYIRYSPDLKNWSSWQVLELNRDKLDTSDTEQDLQFESQIRISYIDRKKYSDLLSDYSRLDVPWKSDEAAAVKWIIEKDPEFFSQQIPFIGYVEFLYENQFRGGIRMKAFEAEIGWGVGGLHSPPKDESVYKDRDNKP